MNMKTRMILVLLFLPMIITNGSVLPTSQENSKIVIGNFIDIPPDTTPIELQGMLDYGAGPNDVIATVVGDYVQIYFYRSFGNVNIDLYNGSGVLVYHDIVNTNVQTMVQIPINSSYSGTYTLVLSNGNGVAEGEFDR